MTACVSPELLFQLAILVVIVIAAVALIRLLMPNLGLGEPFGQVIRILVWAIVCIIIIVFLWKLAACSGLMRL